MKTYTRIYLLFFVMLSAALSFAQSEDVLFHDAGYSYFEKDYPTAYEKVSDGLIIYPNSDKLKELKDLICAKWHCPTLGTPEPCADRDGDGICDGVDPCPDDETNSCDQGGCDSDRDNDGICDEDDQCPEDPTNRCDEPPPPPREISGCTDPEANNYNGNATESCSNCCRYIINTKFKRVPGQNKMTWNPKLAEKATSIRITYTIKPYDDDVALPEEIMVSEVVTGQSYHLYNPQNPNADKTETDVRLYITIDSKTRIVGSKLKRDESFDCSAY